MNILCLTKKSNDTFELWNYTIMDLIEIDHVNKKLLMANLSSDSLRNDNFHD
jgi:hypothetical protein